MPPNPPFIAVLDKLPQVVELVLWRQLCQPSERQSAFTRCFMPLQKRAVMLFFPPLLNIFGKETTYASFAGIICADYVLEVCLCCCKIT